MSTTGRNPDRLVGAPRGRQWPLFRPPLLCASAVGGPHVQVAWDGPGDTIVQTSHHSTRFGLQGDLSGRQLNRHLSGGGSLQRVESWVGAVVEPRLMGAGETPPPPQASVGKGAFITNMLLVAGSSWHQDLSSCAKKPKCPSSLAPPLPSPSSCQVPAPGKGEGALQSGPVWL